jgi:hypothetical protein
LGFNILIINRPYASSSTLSRKTFEEFFTFLDQKSDLQTPQDILNALQASDAPKFPGFSNLPFSVFERILDFNFTDANHRYGKGAPEDKQGTPMPFIEVYHDVAMSKTLLEEKDKEILEQIKKTGPIPDASKKLIFDLLNKVFEKQKQKILTKDTIESIEGLLFKYSNNLGGNPYFDEWRKEMIDYILKQQWGALRKFVESKKASPYDDPYFPLDYQYPLPTKTAA